MPPMNTRDVGDNERSLLAWRAGDTCCTSCSASFCTAMAFRDSGQQTVVSGSLQRSTTDTDATGEG
jgi:hypothetical protein